VYQLQPHQTEALEAALKTLTEYDRVHDVLACGTGKTILGRALSDAVAPRGRVLVLVPRISLVTQSLADYRNLGDSGLGTVLAICSDRSLIWDTRLHGLAVHQTTDPGTLAHAVAAAPGRVTAVATYQSVEAIIRAHGSHGLPAWDLVILDEGHRLTGSPQWARALDDTLLPARHRKTTTATPVVLEKRAGAAGTRMLSMDDEELFGPRCYTLSFPEARRRGLQVSYTVATPVVTHAQVRTMIDRAEHMQVMSSGAISADVMALQLAVLKAMRQWGGSRALTFHPRVVDARLWARTLPHMAALLGEDPDQVWARHLNQAHTEAVRSRVLDEFSRPTGPHRWRFVTNVGLFRDGYDAPACDTVVITHTPGSANAATQMLSRALRVDPDRPDKRALFVLPVVLSQDYDEASLAQILTDAGWGTLWNAMRALGALDEDMLTVARRRLGRIGAQGVRAGADRHPASARTDFPSWWKLSGVPVPNVFADAVTVRAAREIAPAVDEYLGAFDAYVQTYRTTYVPASYITDAGLDLGAWIRRVLNTRRKPLPPYVLERLKAAGLDTTQPYSSHLQGRDEAQIYYEEFGHLRVPTSYVSPRGYKLGHHINKTRSRHRKNELTEEEIAWWNARDMIWDAGAEISEEYQRKYRKAGEEYFEKFGDINAPQTYVHWDEFHLGNAVAYRRVRYHAGTLGDDDIRWHEDRKIKWRILDDYQEQRRRALWEKGFSLARDYFHRTGHLRVKSKTRINGLQLDSWVERQNRLWDTLTEQQQQRLIGIGFPGPIDLDQVRALVHEGATNTQLEARFGMSMRMISGQLARAEDPPVAVIRRRAIASRIRRGHTAADLAAAYPVASRDIADIIEGVERGLFRTDLADAPPPTPKEACQVFEETGGSARRTALLLGVAPSALHALLHGCNR
jgi:superfamily II DNA or RNA helicase